MLDNLFVAGPFLGSSSSRQSSAGRTVFDARQALSPSPSLSYPPLASLAAHWPLVDWSMALAPHVCFPHSGEAAAAPTERGAGRRLAALLAYAADPVRLALPM